MVDKKTVKKEVCLEGVGIHSGKKVKLLLRPSSSGKILFRRSDLNSLEFSLDPKRIETKSSTSLTEEECSIQTIEHLLAVLYVFNVSSLVIELKGCEIPIMDGSAYPFVRAIQKVGIKSLPQKRNHIKIKKHHKIQENDSYVSFYPDSLFRITCSIEYDHPAIKSQELNFTVNQHNFVEEIAPARTFGFLKDVPYLLEEGLALGGSLENAIVLDEKEVINGPLRYPDEFVRHKILDLIGDLFLLGYPVLGHFKAHKAGHSLHVKTVNFITDNPEFWTFV
ncbi:MAG: UDP-3-O-acyl-N-acetylglucosamine deacetylase [Candidatus Aminicenantaceae bacterium]